MSESTQAPLWDNIPEPPEMEGGGGSHLEGPGISPELEKCKAVDLVGEDFAVLGYAKYESREEPGTYFAYVEILTPDSENMKFSTSSQVLLTKLRKRHEAGHIPFRTSLVMRDSKKTAGRKYYDFTN